MSVMEKGLSSHLLIVIYSAFLISVYVSVYRIPCRVNSLLWCHDHFYYFA